MTFHETPPQQPPWPPQPSQPPAKRKPSKLMIAGAAALLLAGFAAGAGTAKTETIEVEKRVEVPGPQVTREIEVPGPTQEVTPAACVQALQYADEGFSIMSDILGAIQADDLPTLEQKNEELAPLPDKYNAAKELCRAGRI